MVRDNWNFTANPFEATLTPASFYCGQPQEEVLARLEWICQERQRFAIVVGAEGGWEEPSVYNGTSSSEWIGR